MLPPHKTLRTIQFHWTVCLSGEDGYSPCSAHCRRVSTRSSSSENESESRLIASPYPSREWTDSWYLDRLQSEMQCPLPLLAEHSHSCLERPELAGIQWPSGDGRISFPPKAVGFISHSDLMEKLLSSDNPSYLLGRSSMGELLECQGAVWNSG